MVSSWIQTLRTYFSPQQFFTDETSCVSYSYDNGRHRALPAAVIFPTSAQEVQSIVKICADHRTPITARGRGTGTPGGAVPTPKGLVISFERMQRILEFCPDSRYMRVEPGVLNQDVQALAQTKNLFWPVDPSSQAFSCVGGNLGYNAGGPHTLKYGAARENILSLEAVTGTGALIKTGFPVTKAASGYDLTPCIIGSEGTLALITEACLKLSPKPTTQLLFQSWFRHEQEACEAIVECMHEAITPTALEFMDHHCLDLLRQYSNIPIPTEAKASLLMEYDETTSLHFLKHFLSIEKVEAHEKAWRARKALSPILRKLSPFKINEDVVVPVHQLPHFLTWLHEETQRANILNVNFGHAGNGNLHVNLLPQEKADLPKAENFLTHLFEKVLSLGGTLSGEHGIGLDKNPFMQKAYSPETLDLMRAIKRQFDPHGILNPDKLLP